MCPIITIFTVTMRNFPFLLILAPPSDKSSCDTSAYCRKDLCLHDRQAELGNTCIYFGNK